MKNNKFMVIDLFIVISFILFSHLSLAEPIVDSTIDEMLKTQEEIEVIITLKDSGTKNLNKQIQTEVLSDFIEDEFILDYASSNGRWFSGNITSNGLNKLKNNPNVLRVYVPIEGKTLENGKESINLSNENEKIKEMKKQQSWVSRLIQFLKSLFNL